MECLLGIVFLISFCELSLNYVIDNEELILVHVLFRHGERTIDPQTIYPNDPYINETYYPYGLGKLTKEGKQREFHIGTALRTRYDNFLGQLYYPDLLDARSTDLHRTKTSLALVLAGLFPPVEKQVVIPGLYWQPIPYNYILQDQDKVLLGWNCPNYQVFYNKLIKSENIQRELHEQKDFFGYLSEKTGWNITNYKKIFNLYFGLRSEADWGFTLPNWTKNVYPQPLENMTIRQYILSTSTTELKQLSSGYFLQKVVEDTKAKISGTLIPPNRKIFLYSAHEKNIAKLLITLGVFKPHIPPYGSYILLEIHRIKGIYGIKVYYQDYGNSQPKLLKIPSCTEFCPFNKFVSLVKEYLPTDDLCGRPLC